MIELAGKSASRLLDVLKTGDEVTLDFEANTLTRNGEVFPLKPLGEVSPVVEAGGIFAYARETGMIGAR